MFWHGLKSIVGSVELVSSIHRTRAIQCAYAWLTSIPLFIMRAIAERIVDSCVDAGKNSCAQCGTGSIFSQFRRILCWDNGIYPNKKQ